jgi:transcriptional regulator with XRE-family HTH domain
LKREKYLLNDILYQYNTKKLDLGRPVRYSGSMPKSRWGEAIAFHLVERGWSQRELAARASLRPNTLTNLIKHGRDSDTATLSRIAAALQVDLAELFLTREQIEILRANRQNTVERLTSAVLRELAGTIPEIVQREVDRVAKVERKRTPRKRASRR